MHSRPEGATEFGIIIESLSAFQGEDVLALDPGVARETRLPLATFCRAFSAKT